MLTSVYGDEARYNLTYGDKFIALTLGSPLLWKKDTLEIVLESTGLNLMFIYPLIVITNLS